MDAGTARATRRWTRAEYERLIAIGFFPPGERAELIDGEIWIMTPQGSAHAAAICLAADVLRQAFGEGFVVRIQLPLALDPLSEPEPDVSVVPGSPQDYWDAHPNQALLVVEVSETTLATDRRDKGGLYARAGIPEYWILNLVDNVLEVRHDPIQTPGSRYGWDYRLVVRLGPADQISPIAAPRSQIPVASMLRAAGSRRTQEHPVDPSAP